MMRKTIVQGTSNTKSLMSEQEKAGIHNKYISSLMKKDCGTKPSSIERKKYSTCQISDSKTNLYNNMKKLLEKKYKKITSTTSSREKLFPEKSRYDPKVYNLKKVKEKTPFNGSPPKKTSSMSDSNTADSRYTLKEDLSNEESHADGTTKSKIETKSEEFNLANPNKVEESHLTTEISEATPMKKKKSALDGENFSKSKDPNSNTNLTKGQEKTKRFKISKRLASLAQPKELPIQVKKDIAFRPFKIPERALLFRDSSHIIKSGLNDKYVSTAVKKKGNTKSIINLFGSNRPHFGNYRKKRRLVKTSKAYFPTPRLLELAKPVPKLPPVDILSPEEVFKVKKRSLKAKCTKRISELAFPVIRPEEYRINVEHPYATKRRSLHAKCTKRVRELAKPLPRRCRSPIRKLSNYDEVEV